MLVHTPGLSWYINPMFLVYHLDVPQVLIHTRSITQTYCGMLVHTPGLSWYINPLSLVHHLSVPWYADIYQQVHHINIPWYLATSDTTVPGLSHLDAPWYAGTYPGSLMVG